MTDCPNVEMRELLPELLHEELDAVTRERVGRHVATCDDCAAELALLRNARATLRAAYRPRIHTASIVAALPRPAGRPSAWGVASSATPSSARTGSARSSLAWRIAAAVAVVSLGGLSFAVARSPFGVSVAPAVAVGGDSGGASPATTALGESALAVANPAARRIGLTTGGGLSDLGDTQLETLLGELERLEAAPAIEPDTLSGSRLVAGVTIGSED